MNAPITVVVEGDRPDLNRFIDDLHAAPCPNDAMTIVENLPHRFRIAPTHVVVELFDAVSQVEPLLASLRALYPSLRFEANARTDDRPTT